MKNSREVRARRTKLGLLQKELDAYAGFRPRTVERIERLHFNRRCVGPEDEVIGKVFKALGELEKQRPKLARKEIVNRMSTRLAKSIAKRGHEESPRKPMKLKAKLFLCPDHGPDEGCWMTASGCESLRQVDPICRSLRYGKGCRGVKHRKVERKTIEVEYTPPSPGDLMPPRRYRTTGE